jgi:hypothetical protein
VQRMCGRLRAFMRGGRSALGAYFAGTTAAALRFAALELCVAAGPTANCAGWSVAFVILGVPRVSSAKKPRG